jgi:hypothetical protein
LGGSLSTLSGIDWPSFAVLFILEPIRTSKEMKYGFLRFHFLHPKNRISLVGWHWIRDAHAKQGEYGFVENRSMPYGKLYSPWSRSLCRIGEASYSVLP